MSTTLTAPATGTQAGFAAGKFLSFQLSKEEYGIAILKVPLDHGALHVP